MKISIKHLLALMLTVSMMFAVAALAPVAATEDVAADVPMLMSARAVSTITNKDTEVTYDTLAKALEEAENGQTIEVMSPVTAIEASGSITGGKTVTITGTALFDWTGDGFGISVGRGGEGNGTLIFDKATIFSVDKENIGSTGINVSGGKAEDDEVNYGNLIIKNSSYIELDYLINRNSVSVEDNSSLTVYGGMYVHGRAAGESFSGKDETATLTIDATSSMEVINANGMGVGDESYGVLNINGGTFEVANSVFDVRENGTINVNGGSLVAAKSIKNAGPIFVSGESTIDAEFTGEGWVYMNDVTLDENTKMIGANVRFASGTNNVEGSTIDGGKFQVGIGAYKGTDEIVDTQDGVIVNVFGDAVIGSNGSDYSGWIGSGYYDTDEEKEEAMTDAKYVLNIKNSTAKFGYMHVSNDGVLNVTGDPTQKTWYNNSDYSFYAGRIIYNGIATFDDTDVLALNTFVSADNATGTPGKLVITNGTEYEAELHNGAVAGSNFELRKTGVVEVKNGATLDIGEHSSIADGAELNVNNAVFKADGTVTNDGAINVSGENAKVVVNNTICNNGALTIGATGSVTANTISGDVDSLISIHAANNKAITANAAEYKGSLELTGKYDSDLESLVIDDKGNIKIKRIVAAIGSNRYESLQDAINAAVKGGTIEFLTDITEKQVVILQKSGADLVIDGKGFNFTGKMVIDGQQNQSGSETLTIQNITFNAVVGENACILSTSTIGKISYAHNVTVKNCIFKGVSSDTTRMTTPAIRISNSADKNWSIIKCSVDNNMHSLLQAYDVEGTLLIDGANIGGALEGINLYNNTNVEIVNSTINVTSYCVRIGQSNTTPSKNVKLVMTNNRFTKGGGSDAAIVVRGDAGNAVINMTENTVIGRLHFSGITEQNEVYADRNYWAESSTSTALSTPIVADGSQAVNVVTYYREYNKNTNKLGNLYLPAEGNIGLAYVADKNDDTTSAKVWGEVTLKNVEKSVQIKIYAQDDKLIGTTTLKNPEKYVESSKAENGVLLTWRNSLVPSKDQSNSWEFSWEIGHPNTKDIPTKVELYVDGTFSGQNDVQMNAPDSVGGAIKWRSLEGVIVADLEGSGAVTDPYLITNLEELKWFRDDVNAGNTYAGKYIQMTKDIDLGGEDWTPIGNSTNKFQGYFDGNYQTISNLKVTGSNNHAGFFGYVNGAGMTATATPSVKNLNLTNVDVSGDSYVGALAGQGFTCNITNVHVDGTVSGTRYVGGLVGHVYTYFENCSFTGEATCSFDALGGIAGAGDCRAYNCKVVAEITGYNWVGGIVGNGQEGTSAVGCYVKGNVSTNSNWYRGVGGIAGVAGHGYSNSIFKNNYFDGEVYLEGKKVNAVVAGIVNVDTNEDIKTTVTGNSWNTEYYPADTKVYVVGDITKADATEEEWIAGAAEKLTDERNNNLIMLESDIPYVEATTIDDVTIMTFSDVDKEDVDLNKKIDENAEIADLLANMVAYIDVDGDGKFSLEKDEARKTFTEILSIVEDGDKIVLVAVDAANAAEADIDFTKDIEFTITGKAPNLVFPIVTFQNATVNIVDAEFKTAELDARQNATINVVNSIVNDCGGDSIVKSYYNGAINISGTSVVHTMQVTTMGYITVSDSAQLNATWQTNVYGNGMITVEDDAVFNTAAMQLTGQDYEGRDNTDADRVGQPAAIVVDGATLTIGKVYSSSNADYSYNSSKGINVGTIDGKSAVLDVKNNATVNIYMANGETANIGNGGTVNVNGSTINMACRAETGKVTLSNKGNIAINNGALKVDDLVNDGKITLKASDNITTNTLTQNGTVEIDNLGFNGNNIVIEQNAEDAQSLKNKVNIVNDTYTTVDYADANVTITVKLPEAFIGDQEYDTIELAIENATSGQIVNLYTNVVIENPLVLTKNVTIKPYDDVEGLSITYTGTDRAIDIPNNTNVSVKIQDLKVVAENAERGINYNTNGKLTLDNVTVKAGHYAVNFPASSDNATVVIRNSDLTALIALNIWGENMTINVTNSDLTSVDKAVVENYAAIQLNNDTTYAAENTTVTVNGGKITALDENGDKSSAVSNWTESGTVTISNTTDVNGNIDTVVALINGAGYKTLEEAFAEANEKTVTLLRDVALTAPIQVSGNVTFDLNGKTVSISKDWTNGDALFVVNYGGTLTIMDSASNGTIDASKNEKVYAAIKMTEKGETDDTKPATLVVNAGIIKGYYYGISGNGTRDNTVININGGEIIATKENDATAIFHPQFGTLTIAGGSIVGPTGIEMRAGELVMNGGKVEANGTFATTANDNGTTVVGAAIALSQHATNKPVEITVNGGTLKGEKAFYQNRLTTTEAASTKISATINVGEIAATIDGPVEAAEETFVMAKSDGSYALKTAVAKIDETKYASLASAIAAAEELTEATVEILGTVNEAVTIKNGNITLIGKLENTITVVGGTLNLVKDSKISSNTYAVVVEGGKLVINDGAIDGAKAAVYVKSGNVEVKGGTLNSAVYAMFIEIEEGITGDAKPVVSISGGNFSGNEESVYSIGTTEVGGGRLTHFITGGNFSSNVEVDDLCADGYEAKYNNEDKVYTVASKTPVVVGETVAKINGIEYESVAEALAAAESGETVTMVADATETMVLVSSGVNVDLNGFTLTASGVVGFNGSNIVDNSDNKTGVLKSSQVSLSETNSQMPIWNGIDGYVFASLVNNCIKNIGEDTISLIFRPGFGTNIEKTYLANGSEVSAIDVMIRLTWSNGDNDAIQNFVYSNDMIKTAYGANKAFSLTLVGTDALLEKGLEIDVVVESNTHVEWVADAESTI